MGRVDEEHRDQVVADSTDHLEHEGEQDQGEDQSASRHVFRGAPKQCERTVTFALDLVVDE